MSKTRIENFKDENCRTFKSFHKALSKGSERQTTKWLKKNVLKYKHTYLVNRASQEKAINATLDSGAFEVRYTMDINLDNMARLGVKLTPYYRKKLVVELNGKKEVFRDVLILISRQDVLDNVAKGLIFINENISKSKVYDHAPSGCDFIYSALCPDIPVKDVNDVKYTIRELSHANQIPHSLMQSGVDECTMDDFTAMNIYIDNLHECVTEKGCTDIEIPLCKGPSIKLFPVLTYFNALLITERIRKDNAVKLKFYRVLRLIDSSCESNCKTIVTEHEIEYEQTNVKDNTDESKKESVLH